MAGHGNRFAIGAMEEINSMSIDGATQYAQTHASSIRKAKRGCAESARSRGMGKFASGMTFLEAVRRFREDDRQGALQCLSWLTSHCKNYPSASVRSVMRMLCPAMTGRSEQGAVMGPSYRL